MKRMYPKVVDLVYKYRTNNPTELAREMGVQVFYVDLKPVTAFLSIKKRHTRKDIAFNVTYNRI